MRAATLALMVGLLMLGVASRAQEEEASAEAPAGGEAPRQPSEADMAIMQKLMAALSAECREEMQRSMTEQTDLPATCQQEIQQIIMSGQLGNRPAPGAEQAEVVEDEAANIPFYAHPTLYITIFLIAFFGAIAYYIYYVNNELEKARKGKKTGSKKKEKKGREAWSING